MKKRSALILLSLCMAALFLSGGSIAAFAASSPTEQLVEIYARSRYTNWDGVTNVAVSPP